MLGTFSSSSSTKQPFQQRQHLGRKTISGFEPVGHQIPAAVNNGGCGGLHAEHAKFVGRRWAATQPSAPSAKASTPRECNRNRRHLGAERSRGHVGETCPGRTTIATSELFVFIDCASLSARETTRFIAGPQALISTHTSGRSRCAK